MSQETQRPVVIKISGHELDDLDALRTFAEAVRQLATPVVIVHGGGKEISALQTAMGIEPRYADGIRVTDAASLSIVEMVLCGTINKRLVRVLVEQGVLAVGLSGVDGRLIHAEKMPHPQVDMGFTGRVHAVNPALLHLLLSQRQVPVIAPICFGVGNNFNVNADHVAGAIAAALPAERLIFLSNVPGVLKEDRLLAALSPREVDALIADGTIFGGMVPKVRTAIAALADGVNRVAITDLAGLSTHGGTVFSLG
ncbi:MAG: acetylglutamate kinase [Aggregatilineales bacterium]